MTGTAALRWWQLPAALALEPVLFGADAWTAEAFWSELAQHETRHYLATWDGLDMTGYAGLAAYDGEAWIQTLGVAPAAQRRGLGALLLVALLTEAARRGAPAVSLEVGADNAAAQRLYARHGFGVVGRRRGYYQATGEDALILTATL